MQKKIFIIVSCVVLIAAAIVGGVFLIKTKDLQPETNSIAIEGTWHVYQKGQADFGQSYFVFADGKVTNYRDGSTTPSFESEYTLSGLLITIAKLEQDFSIEKKTDNVLLLYNQETEYLIVRAATNAHQSRQNYDMSDFSGKYSVSLHANNVFGEEIIDFNGSNFVCTRNGEEYLKTTFSVNNGILSLVTPNGAMELKICFNDVNSIRFVEKNAQGEYLAWELVLIEE